MAVYNHDKRLPHTGNAGACAKVDVEPTKSNMLLIGRIVGRHGADIAFPTQTLHLRGETGAHNRQN